MRILFHVSHRWERVCNFQTQCALNRIDYCAGMVQQINNSYFQSKRPKFKPTSSGCLQSSLSNWLILFVGCGWLSPKPRVDQIFDKVWKSLRTPGGLGVLVERVHLFEKELGKGQASPRVQFKGSHWASISCTIVGVCWRNTIHPRKTASFVGVLHQEWVAKWAQTSSLSPNQRSGIHSQIFASEQ